MRVDGNIHGDFWTLWVGLVCKMEMELKKKIKIIKNVFGMIRKGIE